MSIHGVPAFDQLTIESAHDPHASRRSSQCAADGVDARGSDEEAIAGGGRFVVGVVCVTLSIHDRSFRRTEIDPNHAL